MLRRRFVQSVSLRDRLEAFAEEARAKAELMPPGPERDELKKIRQADVAAHLDDWANSPGSYGFSRLAIGPALRRHAGHKSMEIHHAGSRPTRRAPQQYFTGTVWQDPIVATPAPARVVNNGAVLRQVNRASRSDRRTPSGHWSPLIAVHWEH
jgi:hypothetical protein